MTATVTCNGVGCGKTLPMEGLFGWTKLEPISHIVYSLDRDSGPWHFCSWACNQSFAEARNIQSAPPG